MTAVAIIEQYNNERPNQVDDSIKLEMLKKCEQMIIDTVILTHEDAPEIEELNEHLDNFDFDSELLVFEPYDELYLYYLDQKIAFNNNDTKRYNTASSMYNTALLTFKQRYNRAHKGFQPKKTLLRHEVL